MPHVSLKPEKKEAAALARARIKFGLGIPFKGESRREKQISEAGAQVQSQVGGERRARVGGTRALADSRGVGGDASSGGTADRQAGLQILRAILEEEVTRRVGPPHRPNPTAGCVRWGKQRGYVVL